MKIRCKDCVDSVLEENCNKKTSHPQLSSLVGETSLESSVAIEVYTVLGRESTNIVEDYEAGSDDDGDSLSTNNGSYNIESEEEENDFDEISNENQWKIQDINTKDIKLTVDGPSFDMKHEFKKSIEILNHNMSERKLSLHYGNNNKPSIESQNLAVFSDERFFGEILKFINQNEVGISKKTTMNDLEMFTRCLLVCCCYGCSAKTMWDHKEAFPYFTKAIENIGGINKFITMLSHLKAPKMMVSLTWDNYFDECPHVRECILC